MQPVKQILFPVDFSARCDFAVPYVNMMARRLGAKIILINAVEPNWYLPMIPLPPIALDLAEVRRANLLAFHETWAATFEGLTVERTVVEGEPADVIVQFAEKHNVDLVMMPTHGHGRFRQLLLGSVTAKVLHDCNRPVWTSAHVRESLRPLHVETGTVLCALDEPSKSASLLKSASALADALGAKLRLVHVIVAHSYDPHLDVLFEKSRVFEARQAITDLQKTLGVAAPLCVVVPGDVASAVSEVAERDNVDLVIIGRGVINERLGRLRTNAHAIIRQSPCPVISL